MSTQIDKIRREYKARSLDEVDLLDDPLQMFLQWFDEAGKSVVLDVNAMTLATVDSNGRPSTRIVLLKGLENGKFIFFTNYESKKGTDIASNRHVSACFFWPELERQVRIDGICEKIDTSASEAYFRSRPYESQIGAWVSAQSQHIQSRKILEDKFMELTNKYPTVESIPFPDFWGGYMISPVLIEFWQGRSSRLHDRFQYTLDSNGNWMNHRVSP